MRALGVVAGLELVHGACNEVDPNGWVVRIVGSKLVEDWSSRDGESPNCVGDAMIESMVHIRGDGEGIATSVEMWSVLATSHRRDHSCGSPFALTKNRRAFVWKSPARGG